MTIDYVNFAVEFVVGLVSLQLVGSRLTGNVNSAAGPVFSFSAAFLPILYLLCRKTSVQT